MKTYLMKTLVLSLSTAIVLGMSACSSGGDSGGGASDDTTSTETEETITETVATLGSANLSGTLADSGSLAGAAPSRSIVAEFDLDASAELIVDLNGDGVFGDSEDIKYTATVGGEGAFEFQDIEIAKDGSTDAQLTVSKKGFAPVVKIVSLTDGQNSSIVTEAGAMPVFTEVIKIGEVVPGSYLKIGMKNTSSGVNSYAKIMSLSELRAEAADPSFGEDDLSTSVIPLDAVPDGVTEIKADMKAFDPTNPEDSKYFPGEYKGEGKGDSTDESRLVSVGFDLVSLTDQNGDDIELDTGAIQTSKLRPQAITWENCLQTKVRYLGATQVALIEEMGDADSSTAVFEIPMWYYNSSKGIWSYLGDAAYTAEDDVNNTSGRAYATMCITENWGKYLNLDYDFTITQPKTVCVRALDQEGAVVNNLNITVKKDTAYSYGYLDSEGKAKVSLTAGDALDGYDITYNGSLTGWANIQVATSELVANTTDDACDYDLNLLVQNPYSTTLRVSPFDVNGSIGTDLVYVSNSDYRDYFYQSARVDENGVATFKIKANTLYTVRYRSKEVGVNANGAVVSPETADSTRALSVAVRDENLVPDVYVRFYNREISQKATTAKFYIRAKDKNGDAITLESLTLNGVALIEGTHYSVRDRYQGTSYDTLYATLDLENAAVSAIVPTALAEGTYTISASYSDGVNLSTATATLQVIGNRAPAINGVYFYSATEGYVNLRDVIPAGAYSISAYAYDPDGDDVELTYTLDGDATTDANIDLVDGTHTIVVSATDGNLTTSKSFTAIVGNHPPVITYAGATSYLVDIASTDNSINLFAYANDKEDGVVVKSVQAVDQNGTVYPFTFNENKRKYEAELTPAFAGSYTFNLTATDNNDTNSSVYAVNVQTIANNQEPEFTIELVSQEINVSTSKTFTCEASDPEGTFITYSWSVDGVELPTTSTTLTQTFNTTGLVLVSCTATDGDGKSATSNALMRVVDLTQTGTLVVNTEMQGLLVALHDMTTNEPIPGKEKLTDSTGSASFEVTGDRVTFSISLTSDTAMSAEVLMEEIRVDLVANAASSCSNQPDTNTTCASVDWCSAYDAATIPNWMVDLNPPKDENGTIVATADAIDTNKDGVVDAAELFVVVLSMDDANSDGVITWSEFNNNRAMITTQIYSMVPVKTYTIPFSGYYNDEYWQMSGCEESDLSEFNLTITNLTPDTYNSIYAQGSGYGSVSNWYQTPNVDANGSLTFEVSVYTPGNDGNYTYILKNNTTSQSYILNATATELESDITVSAEDFEAGSEYNVSTLGALNEGFSLSATYNGMWFYPNYIGSTEFGYTRAILNYLDADYIIDTYKYIYVDLVGEVYYGTYNYYGDGTLQTQYTLSDYAGLDVSVSAVGNSLEFGGTELSKVNLVESNYYDEGINSVIDVSIVATQALSRMEDMNLTKILPSSVVGAVDPLDIASGGYKHSTLTEYKDKTESELLDILTEISQSFEMYESISRSELYSDESNWWNLPRRYLQFSSNNAYEEEYGDYEGEYAPSRVQTDEPRKTTMKRPFSIGIDVSKAW